MNVGTGVGEDDLEGNKRFRILRRKGETKGPTAVPSGTMQVPSVRVLPRKRAGPVKEDDEPSTSTIAQFM